MEVIGAIGAAIGLLVTIFVVVIGIAILVDAVAGWKKNGRVIKTVKGRAPRPLYVIERNTPLTGEWVWVDDHINRRTAIQKSRQYATGERAGARGRTHRVRKVVG